MEEIAEVYARALFEAAKDDGVLDRVHDELGQFADTLDEDRNLQVFLFSPYFSSEEKKQGVRRIVTDHDGQIHAGNHQPKGALFTFELPV